MECPIITWKDGDEKREFGNAKIKHYTTYEPTILPYINESLDINKPTSCDNLQGEGQRASSTMNFTMELYRTSRRTYLWIGRPITLK